MDQSKKTMRHFYCRDVLWETFEQMANDFDCSIDYLVNEAMRYYARSKNYQSPGVPGNGAGAGANNASGPAPGYPAGAGAGAGPSSQGPGSSPPKARPQAGTQPPPHSGGASSMQPPQAQPPARRNAPPTPGYAGPGAAERATNAVERRPPGGGASPNAASQPSTHGVREPATGTGGAGPTLFLVYNGQRYPVMKDQFIIGRGSKTSDLPIKDGNISRKHAAVIRRNGTFYIKDLGSTNGIDYKGMRIDNKRIDEGDIFHLCDYELRFTYRAD